MTADHPASNAATSDSPVRQRVAIIGAGPTGCYVLDALLALPGSLQIDQFEAGRVAGPGLPFSSLHNPVEMLANIAGAELPPITETLNAWVLRQPPEQLEAWGIAQTAADPRAFFPRLVIGAYFADQFRMLAGAPRDRHRLVVHCGCAVTDIVADTDKVRIEWTDPDDRAGAADYDRVIIATGYGKAGDAAALSGEVALQTGGRNVGVLGSSLSAIDAAVALAMRHGSFADDTGTLRFDGDRDWHVTFLSRNGLLPEADFYVPLPLEPLAIFTEAAVKPLVRGHDGDLDAVFALFSRELAACDGPFARAIGLDTASADTFADRYFQARRKGSIVEQARANLQLARQTHRTRTTSPWRYAILRMHEVASTIVPALSTADLRRFEQGLKRCFIDNYAAVPHLSIERLLALHDAGLLSVTRLGPDYRLDHVENADWRIVSAGQVLRFDAIIDARGQRVVPLDDFPFATLRLQMCARAFPQNEAWDDGIMPERGFVLDQTDPALSRVHALALPFLLRRRPFLQGLVECAGMAKVVAQSIAAARTPTARRSRDEVLRMLEWLDETVPVFRGDQVICLPRAALDATGAMADRPAELGSH